MTNGWGEPPHVLLRCWPSLQHSLVSPHCQRGNSPPCSATKPRQLFKTGCLSEASFPSNKQSAKPDFGRQGGSTRVTLFPHPVSWSIGAPEGVWAARRWEGWGLQWKPEAMCQAAGGDEPGLHHSGVRVTEQGIHAWWWGGGHRWHACHSITPYLCQSIAESVYCRSTKKAICLHSRKEIWYKLITVHCKVTYKRNRRGGWKLLVLKSPSKALISAEAGE